MEERCSSPRPRGSVLPPPLRSRRTIRFVLLSIQNTFSYSRNLSLNSLITADPRLSSNCSRSSRNPLVSCVIASRSFLKFAILYCGVISCGARRPPRAPQPPEQIMDPGNADPPVNQEVITVFAMTLESPTQYRWEGRKAAPWETPRGEGDAAGGKEVQEEKLE